MHVHTYVTQTSDKTEIRSYTVDFSSLLTFNNYLIRFTHASVFIPFIITT